MKFISAVLAFFRVAVLPLLIVFTASAPEAYSSLLNVKFYPSVPWSVLAMSVYMFLWIKFYKGGILSYGSAYRRECFRSPVPAGSSLKWGIITGFLFATSIFCVLFLLFQTFKIPVTQLPLGNLPGYMVFLFFLKLSIVAGISEEVAFRGYMQLPLENSLGKSKALFVTALFFILAHFGHLEFLYLIPVYVLYSVMLGIITYHTNSLLPSIIIHSVFDFTVFSIYYVLGGDTISRQISETGITPVYILLIIVALLTVVSGKYWALPRLRLISLEKPLLG